MNHDVLGMVRRSKGRNGDGIAMIRFDGREVAIRIVPDDQRFETTLALASDVVGRLPRLDTGAKRVIAADLRRTYNSAWREYDEAQDDGSWKVVSNPRLSAREFASKFSLTEVHVTGDGMVELFYDDSGLFEGHWVVVSSLCGVDFSDARADLFG